MVLEVYAKSVLNKHARRDSWFLDDYSLNPYRSCEFGCIYCYIRGGRYGGGFGQVAVKVNAPLVLDKELSRRARRGEHGFIALSSATEPWMCLEEKYRVTRKCLEVIARHRFPVHCLTKSPLVLRDLDLLATIDETAVLPPDLEKALGRGVLVTFSLSTLDEDVARVFEPGAPSPRERLEALRRVKEEGLMAGVAYIPVLPFISDSYSELENMVREARDVGADYVFFSHPTLQGGCKEAYYAVLERHFPELLDRYRAVYGGSWRPSKRYANRLFRTATTLCRKYGVRFGVLGERA